MDNTYTIEVHRRVYDDENGHYLTIRPSPDFSDTNVLLQADESEKDYFGPVRLDLPAALMRKLGEALISAATDLEAA